MIRPFGEAKNASFETAERLKEAGIPFMFQGGYEGYVPKTWVMRYEAAIVAANGLGMEEALFASTLGAARILGVDNRNNDKGCCDECSVVAQHYPRQSMQK